VLFPEKYIKQYGQDHTSQNTGNNGKIEREVFTFYKDVSGKFAYERQFIGKDTNQT